MLIHFFPYLQFFTPTLSFYISVPTCLIPCLTFLLLYQNIISLQLKTVLIIEILVVLTAVFNRMLLELFGQQHHLHQQIDHLRLKNDRIRKEQQRLISIQHSLKEETMLTERRRIINEIHDILGHQLSGAIIQLAALEYMTDQPDIQTELKTIRQILDQGMHNIRKIIHYERETSINLKIEVDRLIQSFTKCPIHYIYQIDTQPPSRTAYGMIQIIKEALTNINKHSNASHVKLHLREINQKWMLLIYDNGDERPLSPSSPGIGLLSMEERVMSLEGHIHINQEQGFRIFISIPIKEEEKP